MVIYIGSFNWTVSAVNGRFCRTEREMTNGKYFVESNIRLSNYDLFQETDPEFALKDT
jgi:hypothetical protein